MEGASSIHMVRYPREEKFFQIQGCPSTGLAVFLARRASGNSYSAKPKQERQRKLRSVEKMKKKNNNNNNNSDNSNSHNDNMQQQQP